MPDLDALSAHTLGQYDLIEMLGRGGMAAVYKAYQYSLDRFVAIKVFSSDRDPQFAKRFEREARMIATLQHRNILPVYDYGEQDGLLYLVMQYIENGTTLGSLFGRPMAPITALRLTSHVLDALSYAHQNEVVHRDIKPANILMSSPNWPMLADFGIARLVNDNQPRLTKANEIIGTAAYMAPEQATNRPIDARTDLYATGVVLYELVTGHVPFDADEPMTVLTKHVYEIPPPARTLNPALSPAIEQILQRALQKDPNERFQTAANMAAELRRVATELERDQNHNQSIGLYEAGVLAFNQGQWDQAIDRLDSLIALEPGNQAAIQLLENAREAQERARAEARQQREQARTRHNIGKPPPIPAAANETSLLMPPVKKRRLPIIAIVAAALVVALLAILMLRQITSPFIASNGTPTAASAPSDRATSVPIDNATSAPSNKATSIPLSNATSAPAGVGATVIEPSPTVVSPEPSSTPTAVPEPVSAQVVPSLESFAPTDIVIGVVGSFSAPASRGPMISNTVALALEDASAKLRAKGLNVYIAHVDDHEGAVKGNKIADALTGSTSPVVCVVGHNRSGILLDALPGYTRFHMPIISVAATNIKLTIGAQSSSFFRFTGRDDIQAQLAVDDIATRMPGANVYIVSDPSDYGQGLYDEFTTAARGRLTIVGHKDYDEAQTESIIQDIINQNPDVIYLAGYAKSLGLLITQLHNIYPPSKSFPKLFGTDGMDNPDLLDSAGTAAEGMRYTAVAMPIREISDQQLVSRYKNRFNTSVVPPYMAETYDAANLCLTSILNSASGQVTRSNVLAQMQKYRNNPFHGVSGDYTFTSYGDPAQAFYYLREVGQGVTKETWDSNSATLVSRRP